MRSMREGQRVKRSLQRARRTEPAASCVTVLLLVGAAFMFVPAPPAEASTVNVDTTNDVADGNTASIPALLGSRGADGLISLREAILAANNTGGADMIGFNIPGPGPHTIQPTSALPSITGPTTVDGTTEPDFSGSPVVELAGTLAGSVSGLHLVSSDNVVRGLAINRFQDGIVIDGSRNQITGNYVGVDPTGLLDRGNQVDGVRMAGDDNVIGGTTPAERNILSANDDEGADTDPGATGNIIIGNYIGVDITGSGPLGNGAPSGPSGGVLLDGSNSRLGGTQPGEANIIGYNSPNGVFIGATPTGNAFLGNSIFASAALGIDLADDAVTANDSLDMDGGANGLQNYPVLAGATTSTDSTTITGTLNSTPSTAFRIEFFNNPVGSEDASGHGEGRTFLGATSVTTNGSGNASFIVTLPAAVGNGDRISATATVDLGGGNYGSTSEFAQNVAAAFTRALRGTVFEDANYGGGDGRSLVAAAGVGRANARVELYDSAGNFFAVTTTDPAGAYAFAAPAPANYTVRVANASVTSSRSGYVSSLRPVQTFRTDASSGAAAPVVNRVGGEAPEKVDAGNGSVGTTLASLTTATATAQSIAPATLGAADVTGVDFGVNFDTIVNTNNADQGSLRQFIVNANTLGGDGALNQAGRPPGMETSIFQIPTSDPGYVASPLHFTIRPATQLTTATAPVRLDATTQPGFTGTPIVELDGSTAPANSDGLQLNGGGSTVRGFAVNRFTDDGIEIDGPGGDLVSGNYVGTDVTGNLNLGNGEDGIDVNSPNNRVGGTTPADRNVTVGSARAGVDIESAASTGNIIEGNYIGTNAAGTAAIPNAGNGVLLSGGASGNMVGGLAPGAGNLIATNAQAGAGVLGASTSGNSILGNRISANAGLGIDLNGDGVSANNGTLTPGAPNEGMDHPVTTAAVLAGPSLSLAGYVGSAPGQGAFAGSRIEFFRSDADPSAHGEGLSTLGFLTADGSGNFSGSFSAGTLAVGDSVTATATHPGGHTSEFGPNARVLPQGLPIVKRAFLADGTPLANGVAVPRGTAVRFLIYLNNPGTAVLDASLEDLLDPAFQYLPGSLNYSTAPACAGSCSGAEEAAILNATLSGTGATDAVDADVLSFTAGTVRAGNQNAANGQLDVPAARVWASVFTVHMQ